MHELQTEMTAEMWLRAVSGRQLAEFEKSSKETRTWLGTIDDTDCFAKWYPSELCETWAAPERSIAGANLHPAIVPLRRVVQCSDGALYLYDRVRGENLGSQDARRRFSALPVAERVSAVLTVVDALASVADAGFTVVDWYEGNMIYDFEDRLIWLFDWDLCRPSPSFVLDMDSNFGTSRLMAPEEYVRGSKIDQATLIFNLGRFSMIYLPDLTEYLADALAQATHPARDRRFKTVRQFSVSLRHSLHQTLQEVTPLKFES